MEKKKSVHTDEGLQGNERIAGAILALQQEPTEELVAHTLTVLRKRMQEKGQFIVAVEPPVGDGTMKLQTIRTKDGGLWWMVFTGFDEELRGSGSVMSTFMADIGQLFRSAVSVEDIQGVIVNPWNRTLMMDKNLIKITLGEGNH